MPLAPPRSFTGPIGVSNGSEAPNVVARKSIISFVAGFFARDGLLYRLIQAGCVHANLFRLLVLPVKSVGEVRRCGRCRLRRAWGGRHGSLSRQGRSRQHEQTRDHKRSNYTRHAIPPLTREPVTLGLV